MLARDKHSSLFGGSVSDREKVLTPAKLQNFSPSLLMNGQKLDCLPVAILYKLE